MTERWGKTLERVIRLALPAIFENLMLTLVNIVDVAMVGSLGAEATAAAALNAQPLWFANATMMLVAGGAMVLTARCVGSHDSHRAGLYARHGVVLSCAVGALLTAASWLAADVYAALMHAAPDVAPDAAAYMRIVGSSMIFMALGRTLACIIQGTGDTMTPMKISLFANLCNVAGNFLLIYRPRTLFFFGRPLLIPGAGWGVRGAAVSTAASMVLSSLLLMAALARRRDGLKLHLRELTDFRGRLAGDVLSIGAPIAAERIVLSTGQMFYMGIISTLGTLSISAHYLAVTVEGVCYNPAYGVSVAATALVGQSLGAGDEAGAVRSGKISIAFCFAVMACVSALMFCFAAPLIGLFSKDEAIVAQGAMALRIVAWAEPFLGVALTATGALRGAGDTVFPLWLGIFTMYVIRLVSARIFVLRLGLGLAGAWYAMVIDMTLRGLTLWLYFLAGLWKARNRRLTARTGL